MSCGSDASGTGGASVVATSTNETSGRLSYWTTTSGTPAKLGEVATTTLTVNTSLTLTQPISVIGGSASALSMNMANANTWTALQTFANATSTLFSSTYASSTSAYFGTAYIPSLGTAAGSFLAIDPNGKLISTTTPSGSANATLTDSVPFDWCVAQVDSTTFAPGGAFDDFAGNAPVINMMNATSSRIYCEVHIPNSYSSGGVIKWTMTATTSGNVVVDVYGTSTVPVYGSGGPVACTFSGSLPVLSNASSTAGLRMNITGSSVYPKTSTSTTITNTLTAEGNFCAIFERSGLNASDTVENSAFMIYKPFFEFIRKVN